MRGRRSPQVSQSSAESKAPWLASWASSKENQNAGALAATATNRSGASEAASRAPKPPMEIPSTAILSTGSPCWQHHREVVQHHVQRVVAVGPGVPVPVAAVDGGEDERGNSRRRRAGEHPVVAELLQISRIAAVTVQVKAHRQAGTGGHVRWVGHQVADRPLAPGGEERGPVPPGRVLLRRVRMSMSHRPRTVSTTLRPGTSRASASRPQRPSPPAPPRMADR